LSKQLINKILIVFVSLIWILILYKIFFKKKEPLAPIAFKEIHVEDLSAKEAGFDENFEIENIKRDPFLGNISVKKKSKPKKKTKPKVKNKKIRWPFIKYLGLIKKENGEELALLNVNKSFVKMQRGKEYEKFEFKVIKIYRDSILIELDSNTKMIKK